MSVDDHGTVVFAGPSIRVSDKLRFQNFQFLPPIAEGDIFRVSRSFPGTIAIIDGYFGDRMSVSHKEILWALSEGIVVYGAASMGALRAAELDVYGMIGVGEVYHAYRTGSLVDDEAVAVLHGPQEAGYPVLTVPTVDVDATLDHLVASGRLRHDHADLLSERSRRIFFAARTWETIAADAGSTSHEQDDLAALLTASHVERKRLDALELLTELAAAPSPRCGTVSRLPPPKTIYVRRAMNRSTHPAP